MIDLNKVDIRCLYKGFLSLNNKQDISTYKVCEDVISYEDKQVILKSIEIRRLVNQIREVNKILKYHRVNESEIEIKGISGEYMFSKILFKLSKNKYLKEFVIKTPPIAEMILNKEVQDFVIKDNTENSFLTFDVKTQFKNNKYNFLCVNAESFKRLKNQSDFFLLALIDGFQDDFNSNNKITYYYIKNSWFEQNSKLITEHANNVNFTPYYRLSLNIFN